MRLVGLPAVAVALCVGTACSHVPTAPAVRASLQSDRSSYVASLAGTGGGRYFGFSVIARYANESGAPIYLLRCLATDAHPMVGVQAVAESAEPPAFDPPGACVATSSLEIAPGGVRTDTLNLEAPVTVDTSTGIYTGAQQLHVEFFYLASTCSSGWPSCPTPFEARTSNVVTLQIAQ
jgi:hypothetical protein